jgi:CRISPR-associated protein Csm2
MDIPILNDAFKPTKDKLSFDGSWVTSEKGLPAEAVKYAEAFGKYLVEPTINNWNEQQAGKKALSTSQLRNFFGEIRRIQMKGYETHQTDFLMLKPKLAYATARVLQNDKNNRIAVFKDVLILLMDKVSTKKHFDNFVNFVEATVAYHKAYGGK